MCKRTAVYQQDSFSQCDEEAYEQSVTDKSSEGQHHKDRKDFHMKLLFLKDGEKGEAKTEVMYVRPLHLINNPFKGHHDNL